MYEFLTPSEHSITIRNRNGSPARKRRYWNEGIINKVLLEQKPNEDVFVTKYPSGRLLQYIILDFDSKGDKSISLKESKRMMNFFESEGHPCVLVDSTNKGYHLYIKISPFLFKDKGNRVISDWKQYFEQFVRYMIMRSSKKYYTTLDAVNTSAGMGGNIRLINSIHPSTGDRVSIIEGEFNDETLEPTWLQDMAQRVSYEFCEVCEMVDRKVIKRTQIVNGSDPIAENDLREIFPQIFGEEIKHYGGYSMMCCPFHQEKHPSLMITHDWYKCLSCLEKGNIYTLRKKGLLEFNNGKAMY